MMKRYGLFNVTYEASKGAADKQKCVELSLANWFIRKCAWEVPFIKSDVVREDKSELANLKYSRNFNERQSEKYSRGPRRYRSVWFIHECDEFGYWKLTRAEAKKIGYVG